MFAVFDENKSWYVKENIHNQTTTGCNSTDPDVYDSNVIYSKLASPATSSILAKCHKATMSVEMFYLHLYSAVTNLIGRDLLVIINE